MARLLRKPDDNDMTNGKSPTVGTFDVPNSVDIEPTDISSWLVENSSG